MTGLTAYALSKGYTNQSLDGLGALKGAPCTIKSTTETDEGTIIVFEWTGNSGATQETTILVKNGVDGADGKDGEEGKAPTISVERNEDNDGAIITIVNPDGTISDTVTVHDGASGEAASIDWSRVENKPFITLDPNNFSVDDNGVLTIVETGEDNKIDSISVNGTEITPDENKNVDITIPDVPIKSITVNDTEVEPDEDGNVDITIPDAPIQSISQDGTPLSIDENGNVDIPIADTNKIEIVKQNGTALEIDPTDKSVDVLADVNKIEVIKVNNTVLDIDDTDKSVNIEIPEVEVPIKSISLNDTLLEIDEDANVNIEADKNIIETVKVDGVVLTVDEDDKSINIELQDYAKTEEVEQYVDVQLYTTVTTEAHYEITESTTANALEVVADGTAVDGQIDISSVTPLLDGVTVAEGDYVVWVEATKTKEAKFLVDTDLEPYVEHTNINVLTENDILDMVGLSTEELEGLATLLSDAEIRIDKTYSSSKITSELTKVLDESKAYTLSELSKSVGASYKVVADVSEMTSNRVLYLLKNAENDNYDIYIYDEETSLPEMIGDLGVDLTDYYSKAVCDERFVLATAFELLNNSVGDVTTLQTTAKVIVDSINEVATALDETKETVTENTNAIGDITTLETTVKDNVVNAVNEVKKSIDEFEMYVELTQAEYDALPDDDTGKLNGTEYRTTDTGKIYKNGMQYGGQEPETIEGFSKFKEMKEQGLIDPDQEYIVSADAEGILLGAEDIGYSNTVSNLPCTTVQGAVDKVAEKVDNKTEIDDTSSSTTNTYSSAKIDEKYDDKVFGYTGGDYALEIQLDDRKIDIEIVDNCGGKIELLGNGAIDSSVNYRFIKVLRLSYGNWTEFDATKPNDTYTKIKEVYVDTTNKKAYVHLKGNANYIVKGAKSVISKNYTDVDTSTMTLIPESKYASINEISPKADRQNNIKNTDYLKSDRPYLKITRNGSLSHVSYYTCETYILCSHNGDMGALSFIRNDDGASCVYKNIVGTLPLSVEKYDEYSCWLKYSSTASEIYTVYALNGYKPTVSAVTSTT